MRNCAYFNGDLNYSGVMDGTGPYNKLRPALGIWHKRANLVVLASLYSHVNEYHVMSLFLVGAHGQAKHG